MAASITDLANSLMLAIQEENSETVSDLLIQAYEANILDDVINFENYDTYNGETPLIYALKSKVDLNLIEMLINAGVDVNLKNKVNDATPLAEFFSTTSGGRERDLAYTFDVLNLMVIKGGASLNLKSGDMTILELVNLSIQDTTKETILERIRILETQQKSLEEITMTLDNLDEDDLDTMIANLTTELEKDPLGNVQILDMSISQGFTAGYTPIFYLIKNFFPPRDLLRIYNLFVTHFRIIDDDTQPDFIPKGNILHQTFTTLTPLTMFILRFKTFNPETEDFFRQMCIDFSKINGVETTTPFIDYRDKYGLTILDYAEASGVQQYVDIIKEIYPDAKRGTELPPQENNLTFPFFKFPNPPMTIELRRVFEDDIPEPRTPPIMASPEAPPPLRRDSEDSNPQMGDLSDEEEEVVPELNPSEIELPDPLPDDREELKQLLNNLVSKMKRFNASNHIFSLIINMSKILTKDYSLVNEPLDALNGAPVMFSVFLINPESKLIVDNFIQMMKGFEVNPLLSGSDGTILETSIKENNLNVLKSIIKNFKFDKLLKEESDVLPVYQLANEQFEMNIDNENAKQILQEIFYSLMWIVLESQNEENYKWLPSTINNKAIYLGEEIKDLPYYETVCKGIVEKTGNIIKNDVKILEFLLKNGAHAFYSNPYIDINEDSPLGMVLFERKEPAEPSPEMVKLLLDYGAQMYTGYTYNPDDREKYDWDFIDYILEDMEEASPENKEKYEQIISILYNALALEIILSTPLSDPVRFPEREDMLNNLIKYHPAAFSGYPKPEVEFTQQEINPEDLVYDVITLEETKIADFLAEDRENHIVMRDYDNPESTFLINLNNFRKAIEVDYTPLGPGEIDEKNVPPDLIENPDYDDEKPDDPDTNPTHIIQTYDPANPNHVPLPGKKGGSGIMYKCNEVSDGTLITLGSVNNMVPYFDLKSVAGWGGLIPLLELYSKLLNFPYEERGQYFNYKVLDQVVNPLSGIASIAYAHDYEHNRYGGLLNYVSGSHCQDGQFGNVTTIIPAKMGIPKKGGKKKNKTVRKKKQFKIKKTLRRRRKRKSKN